MTRKITRGIANIALGLESCIFLGNMDALRDWGHAKDYVHVQWLMLQQETAEDFVVATGHQKSVREFVELASERAGIGLEFSGEGTEEIATVVRVDNNLAPEVSAGDVIVRVDPRYFRPTEVDTLLGDSEKARKKLGWEPEFTVAEICAEMVDSDLVKARQLALLKEHGHDVSFSVER